LQTDITNLDDLYVGLVRAKLAILRGDLAAAGDWVQERGLLGELDPAVFDQKDNYYQYHIMKYELLAMARWLIAGDQPQKALALLAILHKKMEEQGRIHLVIESLLLRSIAYQMLGDRVQAPACFNRCLVMAEPGGYVRLFLDGGPEVKVLLQEAVKSGTATVYAERLLAAFETGSPPSEGNIPVPQLQPSSPSGLPETLTEREIELLSLIAQGLSNQEIARRLFISLPTVKWHTGNIYGKLGVRSRTQAVVQARFLGILPAG
jgi:LuxR family maltose regulon positive regulatory protein